ncbi:MAG TPA: 4-alpha-glucanotransferase [Mycobacteriales bacterium]|nr:4-alpha-glucanotransferase [Mycobacteriales bacterium]
MRSAARDPDALRRLAHAHGIQLSYTASNGRRVRASHDSLVATLNALGIAVSTARNAHDLLAELERDQREAPLEPVVVVDRAGMLSSQINLPPATEPARCQISVTREDGEVVRRGLSDLVARGGDSQRLSVDLTALDLPPGYHELSVEGPGFVADAMLLVPPARSSPDSRSFGVFAPAYALRGSADWGVGTFTELAQLADYVGMLGGEILGTLPMFPTSFATPVDPSPYLPVSRLFVNELFIDVEALPEFARSDAARAIVSSPDFTAELAALRRLPRVDYGEVMARKRRILTLCAAELLGEPSRRRDEFEEFLAGHPELASYAGFRATGERIGVDWHDWGGSPGELPAGPIDHGAERYHLYAQFVAADQLAAAADHSIGARAALYLDLPLGVHPDGFDTWSRASLFAAATVGAPPDRLAPQGQAWGFPPLHPVRLRRDRYRYVIDCYRHLLAHAGAIRIDHVLGLERLFWIPPGAGAESGAYVRYRSEELLAIVAIEAARAGAVIVGEDLGTASGGIRPAMDRVGMLHSFVYQFSATATEPFPQPVSPSMATLGSHDLPRFAAFWHGEDIDDRVARGVTSQQAAIVEHRDRDCLVAAVEAPLADRTATGAFTACIGSLAAGPAPYVMVDLADIEGETEPDNRPGTGPAVGNWRRRLPRGLPAIVDDNRVRKVLTTIAAQRQLEQTEEVSA